MNGKIRVALTGIGNRALPKDPDRSNWFGWVDLIDKSGKYELVATHDPAQEARNRIISRGYIGEEKTFAGLEDMLKSVDADVLLVTCPAEFHAPALEMAIKYGLHMLVEKPLAVDLSRGFDLVRQIETHNLKSCVIQNWRYKDTGRALARFIKEGRLGPIGHVFFRYVRNRENPNYPSYIFEEEYPLLYAMGIHHFDLFRSIFQEDIVQISGQAFKPPWSLYRSETGHNLFMKTTSGIPIVYTGTISSQNRKLMQECLIIEGEKGTLVNESQWLEPPLWFYPSDGSKPVDLTASVADASVRFQYDSADQYILEAFHATLDQNSQEICSARDGMMSVMAVEMSRMACQQGKTIYMDDFLDSEEMN